MTTSPYAVDVVEELEPLVRVSRELVSSAEQLTQADARYLVGMYYGVQEMRIRADGQIRAADDDLEADHPVVFVAGQFAGFERNTKRLLRAYAEGDVVGRWAMSVPGIGEVLASGLLAHVNIEKAVSVGKLWRFAGLDPTQHLRSREDATALYNEATGEPEERLRAVAETLHQDFDSMLDFASFDARHNARKVTRETCIAAISRRTWNAALKVLCWKIGESFVKVSGRDNDVYGHIYADRKVLEIARNESGQFADQAAASLAGRNYGRDTIARQWYEQGKLPPARIHLRAQRYAVKLFLAHYHEVAFFTRYGVMPPKPYIFTAEPTVHTHFIGAPFADTIPGLEAAQGALYPGIVAT